VLHPRTLEPLEPLAIPLFVGHTLEPRGKGTWIGPWDAEAPARREEDGTAA